MKHPCIWLLCMMALQISPTAGAATTGPVDLLISGGRVIDPASGRDAIRDVAIADGRIVAIGPAPLLGPEQRTTRVLDASGLVVAPGFIDLHVHGQSDAAHEYQARDGVTTALELEWGYPEIASFLDSRRGSSRVNYGASVSHGLVRALALAADDADRAALRARFAEAAGADEPLVALQPLAMASFYAALDATGQARLHTEFERQLSAGGIGIGMAHAYYPGADGREIFAVFETAADTGVPIFTHVRGRGLAGVQEVVANAAATGAALHVVHVGSSSLDEIEPVLALIHGARTRGLDVSTEVYPYTAGSTTILAALFDGDWQQDMGISYQDIQWQATGERLTEETFARYRQEGGVVIIHMLEEAWVEQALGNDWVMVASDGMPYDPGAHPRTAGTFSRVLGHYVRGRELIDLATAIRKMTLLPAQRLEAVAPQMARKGRIAPGMDADLVLFDPATVIDTATFESGPSFSEGIEYVFVAGEAIVARGESVPDVFPGQPIMGRMNR